MHRVHLRLKKRVQCVSGVPLRSDDAVRRCDGLMRTDAPSVPRAPMHPAPVAAIQILNLKPLAKDEGKEMLDR